MANIDQLLKEARSGNSAALAQLLDCYRHYLGLLARMHIDRFTQSKLDEADLVQDTMLQATRFIAQFRGTTEKELITWLRRILATQGAVMVRQFHNTKQRNVRLEKQLAEDMNHSSIRLASFLTDTIRHPADMPSGGKKPSFWPTHLHNCQASTVKS